MKNVASNCYLFFLDKLFSLFGGACGVTFIENTTVVSQLLSLDDLDPDKELSDSYDADFETEDNSARKNELKD